MILAIYCAGGLGREVLGLAWSINRWSQIVFVDDVTNQRSFDGITIYRFEEVARLPEQVEFVIANGEPAARKSLYDKVKAAGYRFATIQSPGAWLYPGSTLGEGCIVWDCTISTDVTVRENVLIGTKVSIGHDVEIGSHSMISAHCFIGGNTHFDEQVYLAPGALVKDRIHIQKQAIISLGAVILRNVKPQAIMIGNPAKHIGENTESKVFNIFDEN